MATDDQGTQGGPPPVPPTWRGYDAASTPGAIPPASAGSASSSTPPPPPPAAGNAAPYAPYAPPTTQPIGARKRGGRIALVALAAAALGVGGITVVSGAVSDPEMFSREAVDDLVEDLRDETGNSLVYEVTFYDDHALVEAQAEPGTERSLTMHWDGSLDEWGKGTTDEKAFDLTQVDGSLLDRMCDETEAEVEDPTICYVVVRVPEPDPFGGPADGWYAAHASNDFSEGGYILYDRDGAEIERHFD